MTEYIFLFKFFSFIGFYKIMGIVPLPIRNSKRYMHPNVYN